MLPTKRLSTLLWLPLLLTGCHSADEASPVVGQLATDRVLLSADFREPLVEFLVAEGEAVSAGQVIARLDQERAQAQLDEARGARLQAQARLEELLRGPGRSKASSLTFPLSSWLVRDLGPVT